jgi:hypothetical protein
MNFSIQEKMVGIFTDIFKNKFIVNTIFLFLIVCFLLFKSFLMFVFYIKFIKKRIFVGTNKDVKDGNVPFINIDKLKDSITI